MAKKNSAELEALLKKELELTGSSSDTDSKAEYFRRQKAKEVVSNYLKVVELKAKFKEDFPELKFTAEVAAELLYQEWTDKAVSRHEQEI